MRFDSNSPDVMTVRGLLLFLTSKTAQATQHVQSALRLDPGHEAAMKLRKRIKDVERLKEEGNVAFKGGRLAEAAQKYGAALDRIGSDDRDGGGGHIRAMLLSNRATTLVKLERYEDALADTEASLELNATLFKALRTRARINLHLEKYDTAIADFNSAIEQAGFENCDADVRALRTELKKAEIALKRSKTKDYYKILGVDRDCSDTDIRKAYRRESLKHHPDKVCICREILCVCHIFNPWRHVGWRRRTVQAHRGGELGSIGSTKAPEVRHGRGRGRRDGGDGRCRPVGPLCSVPWIGVRRQSARVLVVRWRWRGVRRRRRFRRKRL